MATNEQQLARIHERLDEIVESLSDVGKQLAGIAVVCPETRKLVAQHHRSLYGSNGDPGLVGVIHEMREDARKRDEAATRRQKQLTGVFAGLAALLSALASVITKALGG